MKKSQLILKPVFMFVLALVLVFSSGLNAQAAGKKITMTLAHADVADPTQHIQAGALAFKEYVEKSSDGNITVNISPGSALGNTASLQEMTMSGEIEASTSHTEGTIAIVFPNIQVISIPYLFDAVDQALEVFRGEYGAKLYEDMRQKTGLRVIGVWDNGGFRSFTNNKRVIKTPADMQGLRIRTMDIPAHMEIVRSLGGKPTPISWKEVYTALETGVVDGQENAIPTIILGSLQEVQKYLTLDGHVYTQIHMYVNEQWFQSLPKEYQDIILRGGEKAGYAGQRSCRVYREIGEAFLSQYMEIYHPTLEEKAEFRKMAQGPVLKFIRKAVDDQKWVDDILEAAQTANKKLGYTK